MKTKVLNIIFESWEDFKLRTQNELRDVVQSKKPRMVSKNVLVFDSVSSYQKLMSEQKYMILAAIRNLKPSSIYQLAKLVGRDFSNVKKDCEILESVGFIVLEKSESGRRTKMAKLVFDYDVIEIHTERIIYSHNLGKLAA